MANITASKTTVGNSIAVNAGDIKIREMSIRAEDIINAGTFTDGDTATFAIPVKAGEIVEAVTVSLKTAFDDSGAGGELNILVGDGSDADGFITTAQLHVDDTEISYVYNTGAYFVGEAGTTDPANATNGKLYTADDTIDILLVPDVSSAAAYSLEELTQGEVLVKVKYFDAN